MRVWPALLVAPILALVSIGLGYALVDPACSAGGQAMLHAAILIPLLLAIACTAIAYRDRRSPRDPFLSLVATGVGAFFSLVIAAQWATQLFLSPCMP
jgi:hypothetical protein